MAVSLGLSLGELKRAASGGGGVPANSILDEDVDPLLDEDGDYLLEDE